MLYTALTILHVVVCLFLILVVLLQAGKGGGMGIAFGGGGSQTVFGSSGAGNFLTRLTAICAAVFFLNSLILAYLSSQSDSKRLQGLSSRKAAEKQAQQAATAKIAKDLEKARKEIEKGSVTPGSSATPSSEMPATGTTTAPAPAPTPAPGAATPPAAPAGTAPSGTTTAPAGSTSPAAPATPGESPKKATAPPAAPASTPPAPAPATP